MENRQGSRKVSLVWWRRRRWRGWQLCITLDEQARTEPKKQGLLSMSVLTDSHLTLYKHIIVIITSTTTIMLLTAGGKLSSPSSPTCCCQLRAPLRRHQVGHHHHDHFGGNAKLLVEKCELLLSRLPVSLPFLRDSRRRGRREELDWRRHTTIFNSTNSLLSTKVSFTKCQ